MDFKIPYQIAMREQAPKLFNHLRRSGGLEAHVHQKSVEAHQMLDELTANAPKLPNGLPKEPYLSRAESLVFETLIEFPSENPESETGDPLAGTL